MIRIGLLRRDAETGGAADDRLVDCFQATFGHMKVL